MQFLGFTLADFNAYRQDKWTSHAFNRERLQIRQKLEALGKSFAPLLCAADGSPLVYEVSSEHPTIFNQHRVNKQYLFFSRNLESRRELESLINRGRSMASLVQDPSPLRNHVFLSLMIEESQVDIALNLHSDAAVDRENLQRRCNDFFQREKLLQVTRSLPPGFRVGLVGQEMRASDQIDDTALSMLISALPTAATWLCFGRTNERAAVLDQGASFADIAAAQLTALLPLLHLIAWRRDNDFVSIKETLRQQDMKHRTKGLQKNDTVKVHRGMFAGKVGRVQSIDAKGGVKVLLGTLLVKLEGDDVIPAGK